jgi:hypothetical protein
MNPDIVGHLKVEVGLTNDLDLYTSLVSPF